MKKLPYLTVLVILMGSFFIVNNVEAATLAGQSIDSSNSSSGFRAVYQTLGNGISGVADQFSFKMSSNSVTSGNFDFISCTANDYNPSTNSCTGITSVVSTNFTTAIATTTYFITFTEKTLNSSLYYVVIIQPGNNSQFFGSSSNLYSGGVAGVLSGGVSLSPVVDLYFFLTGAQTVFDTSYTSNLSPANASTTASTNVNLSFDYYAAVSNNIDKYYINLNDLSFIATSTGDIELSGTASSGSHSVSRTITLTSGHTYGYQATVCSTSTGICYGGAVTSFSVVNDDIYAALIGTELEEATTTNSIATAIFRRFFDFKAKPPFSFIGQVYSAWRNAEDSYQNSTSSLPTFGVNLTNASTNIASTSIITPYFDLPNFNVVSKDVILVYLPQATLNFFLTLQIIGFYASLIWYVYRRVPKFVSEI